MKCFNCQKDIIKEISRNQRKLRVKICPWCTKNQAPRQSLRSQKSKKK